MQTGFNIIITDDVKHFLDSLEPKAREKIAYDMALSQKVENRQLLKKLDDTDLWEFRTHFDGEAYRVLAFEIPGKNTMVAPRFCEENSGRGDRTRRECTHPLPPAASVGLRERPKYCRL